jgi:GNAT superfamily N-acetyltransferase
MIVRAAKEREIDHLARIWHEGWNDAHSKLAPAELVKARTLESFRERLAAALADTRVVGPVGSPLGLCMIKDDELYQLYVAPEARGAGVAAALLDDGEARLADRGVRRLGSPVRSATTGQQDSTRNAGGTAHAR